MKKADKFSLVFILFLIFYLSSMFILNTFVIDQELNDLFANFTFMIFLTGVFSFFGYLIIKAKKYTRNQRIFLLFLLIIFGFIDIILFLIATVSGLTIHYAILGIYNSISLGTFCIVVGIIESKSSKKRFFSNN
jgi:hypothetical protein